LPEVFARDGGWGVFAAVAGAGEDGGEGWHGGGLLIRKNQKFYKRLLSAYWLIVSSIFSRYQN
jgi:hypothetical protein